MDNDMITYDPLADAMYIYLSHEPVDYTVSVNDVINIDYGNDGAIRGIEILAVRHVVLGEPQMVISGVTGAVTIGN